MKTLQKSFVALIIVLCLIPSLGLLLFGPSEPASNEISPSKPAFLTETGKLNPNCLQELTDYIAGSFALRRECISAWSWLNGKLFHTSVQNKVVLGADGWLYYSETLDDYEGRGLTGAQQEAAVRNLALMEEYVRSCGAEFVFTAAPNKNSLYPQNMPSYYVQGHGNSNADGMEPLFEKYEVTYVNLFQLFAGREDVLYYATDTHWNAQGAALACDTIVKAFGKTGSYADGPFVTTGVRTGDLFEMLIPEGKGTETGITYGGTLQYECQGNPKEGNAITIKTTGASSGRLKCWRDSFGIELYPYLADQFENAVFSRLTEYNLLDVRGNYDCVLIELCERNLAQLLTQPAVYPAPKREVPTCAVSPDSLLLSEEECSDPELKHMIARLPGEADCAESVFLFCGGDCYEAAVTLSGEEAGLSAFIPSDAECSGIIVTVNGEKVFFPAAA